MSYVNYLGQEIGLIVHPTPKKAKKENTEGSHNGWRVQGIPPGAGSVSPQRKPWDEEHWLMNAGRKPVAKPFSIPEAAQQCKALAEKAGWLRVEVVELKKEPAKKAAS